MYIYVKVKQSTFSDWCPLKDHTLFTLKKYVQKKKQNKYMQIIELDEALRTQQN